MRRLIIISGCGGAGKETIGRLLFEALARGAWIDIKTLIRVKPWEYGEPVIRLGMANAASLVNHFFDAGLSPVIVSGGPTSQQHLDLLLAAISGAFRADLVWLHADKAVRDRRRLRRSRDDADLPEHLDHVDRVVTDPGELRVECGRYHRFDTSGRSPGQVLQQVLAALQLKPPAGEP